MRSEEREGDFYGFSHVKKYKIDEETAGYYSNLWSSAKSSGEVVNKSLSNVQLWETDLSILPGFAASVNKNIQLIEEIGILEGIKRFKAKRIYL